MKIVIEQNEDNLASLEIFKEEKITQWQELTQEEKEDFVMLLRQFYSLFSKCL